MNRQTTNSESQSERALAKIILLGLDVHADSITVVRQIDGAMPQPAQKFSPAGLLEWMKRQRELAESVWSCYEAGPFGYGLHRQLEALGVHNLVVCPQSWDELSTGVKTDKGDARALCVRLALYAAGNRRVFSVVPSAGPGPSCHGALVAGGRLVEVERHAARLAGGVAGTAARVYFDGAPKNGAPDPNGGGGREGVSTGWVGGSEQ